MSAQHIRRSGSGCRLQDPKGFTLVELLVVIGVIMVLAGIIYAVFASVRKRGLETVCVSNLRQIGMAMKMYMQDYETFPSWEGGLLAYTRNTQIFLCPLDPNLTKLNFGPSMHQFTLRNSYRFDTLPTQNGLYWKLYDKHPSDYPVAYDRNHWELANLHLSRLSWNERAPVFILRADGRVNRLTREGHRGLGVDEVLELAVGEAP